jgi:predicted AAA+ superfamily ATPase
MVDFLPFNGKLYTMLARHLAPGICAAARDTPVVFIQGPRQAGKSTLVGALPSAAKPWPCVTLDEAAVAAAAHADPASFLAGLPDPVVIDEVQRAPGLFRAIKLIVDRRRTPGRFILTGSASILVLPQVSDALAGRMQVVTLLPFSQGEIDARRERFIDLAFAAHPSLPPPSRLTRPGLVERIVRGGFAEVVGRTDPDRRAAWFESYVATVLQRDVRDLSQLEQLPAVPRLLSLLAARCATILNVSEVSRSAGIPSATLHRYLALLQGTFLLHRLPSWSRNLVKRLTKAPKSLLVDTGLACHLVGAGPDRLTKTPLFGPMLENFVAMELMKQRGWSQIQPAMYHYHTATGQEIDLVLEDRAGRCVTIEVKATATVDHHDFGVTKRLASELGHDFVRGIVLYGGTQPIAFGPNLVALPIDSLWTWGAE